MNKPELINEEIIRIQEIMGVDKKNVLIDNKPKPKPRIFEATTGPGPLQFIEELFGSSSRALGAAAKSGLFNKLKSTIPELANIGNINGMLTTIRNNVDVAKKIEEEILSDPKFVDELFEKTVEYAEKKPSIKMWMDNIAAGSDAQLIDNLKGNLQNTMRMSDELWVALEQKALQKLQQNIDQINNAFDDIVRTSGGQIGISEVAVTNVIRQLVKQHTTFKLFGNYLYRNGESVENIATQVVALINKDPLLPKVNQSLIEKGLKDNPAKTRKYIKEAIEKLNVGTNKALERRGFETLAKSVGMFSKKSNTWTEMLASAYYRAALVIVLMNIADYFIELKAGKHKKGEKWEGAVDQFIDTMIEASFGPFGTIASFIATLYELIEYSDTDVDTGIVKTWAESDGGFASGVTVTKNSDDTYTIKGKDKATNTDLTLNVKMVNGVPEAQL